ncbi:hypothetical protein NMY22_g1687 [Coprinellus aureogranulatus]|nr:hypothetical protein NMY22_g1687 [Coprinellus aureogranulatus]
MDHLFPRLVFIPLAFVWERWNVTQILFSSFRYDLISRIIVRSQGVDGFARSNGENTGLSGIARMQGFAYSYLGLSLVLLPSLGPTDKDPTACKNILRIGMEGLRPRHLRQRYSSYRRASIQDLCAPTRVHRRNQPRDAYNGLELDRGDHSDHAQAVYMLDAGAIRCIVIWCFGLSDPRMAPSSDPLHHGIFLWKTCSIERLYISGAWLPRSVAIWIIVRTGVRRSLGPQPMNPHSAMVAIGGTNAIQTTAGVRGTNGSYEASVVQYPLSLVSTTTRSMAKKTHVEKQRTIVTGSVESEPARKRTRSRKAPAATGVQSGSTKRARRSTAIPGSDDEFSVDGLDEDPPVKKRIRRDDFWVFDETNSSNALSCLEAICALPAYCPTTESDCHLEGPSDEDVYTFTHGSVTVSCSHTGTVALRGTMAYGGCAALTHYNLYWSGFLGCIISIEKKSAIFTDDLASFIMEHPHFMDGVGPQSLTHIQKHFPMDSKDILVSRWRLLQLDFPLPGLSPVQERRRCPDCGLWTAATATHTGKHPECKGAFPPQMFAILLVAPSIAGEEIRIKLNNPARYNLEKSAKAKSSPEQELMNCAQESSNSSMSQQEALIRSWMDAAFTIPRGFAAPKLKPTTGSDDKFYFEMKGKIYRCEHSKDTPPPPESDYYTGCAVLTFYQLFFCPKLQALVCPGTGFLMDQNSLRARMKIRTPGLSDDTILKHITASFSIHLQPDAAFEKVHRGLLLRSPILGLPRPDVTFQCPDCGVTWKKILLNHKCEPKSDIRKTYTISLWSVPKDRRYSVAMDPAWIELNRPVISRKIPIPAILYSTAEADYLKGTGYIEHFESWKCELPAVLQLLSMTPSGEEWTTFSLLKKVNACMAQLRQLVLVYVWDVEERLEHLPMVRNAAGSFGSDRRPFSTISKNTFRLVRRIILHLLALAIRYCALQLHSSKRQYKSEWARLGSFSPLYTAGQRDSVVVLLESLSKSDTLPSDDDLLQFIHNFLLETFGAKHPVSGRVSSIVEQLIILLCLTEKKENKQWRSATYMHRVLVPTIHRIARSVVVHTACLGGKDVRYKAVDLEALGSRGLDNEPDGDAEACSLDESEPLEDLEEEWRTASQEHNRILVTASSSLEILQEMSSMLNGSDRETVYGRMEYLQKSLSMKAATEPFSARVAYDAAQHEFTVSWKTAVCDRRIRLEDVQELSFGSVMSTHRTLQKLIPPHIWNTHLSHLSVEDFVDDWNEPSIFHLPKNAQLLSPAITSLYSTLEASPALLEKSIETSQQFLAEFARALYLNTGIPPMSSQTAKLRFAADEGGQRNFMLEGSLGLLMWKATEGFDVGHFKKGEHGVWHTPPRVTLDLIIYLGVYRDVEHKLLTERSLRLRSLSATHALSTHIFADPCRRQNLSIIWPKIDIDMIVSAGPMNLTPHAHRILFSSIISNTLAPLIDRLNRPTVLDDQGQHTQRTSATHYAVLPLQRSNGFHYPTLLKQILVCQELHASSGLAKPVNSIISSASQGLVNPMVIMRHNIPHAFNIARNAVISAYRLGFIAPGKVEVVARAVYLKISLHGILTAACPGAAGGAGFTSEDLLTISRSLVGSDMDVELVRASAREIAGTACTLMLRAITEWLTGKLEPTSGSISPFSPGWSKDAEQFCDEPTVAALPQWGDFVEQLCMGDGGANSVAEEYDLPPPVF